MPGRGNRPGNMGGSGMGRNEGMNREGMGRNEGMGREGMGRNEGMGRGEGMNHGQHMGNQGMGGFGMGHQEPVHREMPRHEGNFFGEGMRREPFPPHHEERPRPHHSLPFGLIAAANVIWNQVHYQRIHRILEKMYYNEMITREEEDVLYENFGRYINYEEVPQLLSWTEQEMRYF